MAGNNNFTHLPLPFIFRGKPKLRGGKLPSEQTIKIGQIVLLMVVM